MPGTGTWVFAGAAAAVLYILFGYPLLLAAIARRRARPVFKQPQSKSVSILVAVYNGEHFIAEKLRSLLALEYPRELLEIIVISDGSSDQTESITERFVPMGVRLLRLPRGGKPAALNAGITRSRGEILIFTDVRQTLAPDSVQHMVDCFADPTVGVVSGELIIRKGASREEADVGLYWHYEFWIRNNLASIDSIFGATGALYAMRRELAVPMPPEVLLDDMHLPLHAFFRGYRLIVEPKSRVYDFPTSLDTEFKRKVRTLAGNYQILAAFPLLGPRNRMWVHFVSYKFGRLLLPWLLAVMAISGFFLPVPWVWLALASQSGFYALGVLDFFLPERSGLRRLSSPVRTFVVLMAAAACAVSVLFVPAQALWKETKVKSIHG
jgi:poly-beta-1,6-N-acetyl-D-glucosamine synthase